MLKNILKVIAVFILGTCGGIFAEEILWPYFVERPLFYQYDLDRLPYNITETKEIIIQENTALSNAVEKVEKVVVGIKTKTKNGKILEGSGLILTSDGLAITFADLVPQGAEINFFWEGKNVSFQILKRDLKENFALAKLEETNLPTAGMADPEKTRLGERIFFVAAIFKKQSQQKIVNEGIIKGFDESALKTNIIEKENARGSPLFNIEGKILGLNAQDAEGTISAISISKIRTLFNL